MKTLLGNLKPDGSLSDAFEVDLRALPSDDPIAYAFGLLRGRSGDPCVPQGERRSELAPEYIRGWREGRRERGAK